MGARPGPGARPALARELAPGELEGPPAQVGLLVLLHNDIEDCLALRNSMGVGNGTLGSLGMGCSNDNQPQNWPNWQAQARSKHSGGVNVCFADGSVRFIVNTIPSTTRPRSRSTMPIDSPPVLPTYIVFPSLPMAI